MAHGPKVFIQIVAWNSMSFLPELLASIEKQTYKNIQVLVLDQGSTDGAETFIKSTYPPYTFVRYVRHLGMCVAQNQGIRYILEHHDDPAEEKAILFVQPNMILSETCVERLVESMNAHPECGSFGGKILRAFREGIAEELKDTVLSDRLDGAGLHLQKDLSCTVYGVGEMDEGQFDVSGPVFGHPRCLMFVNTRALSDILCNKEYFDEDFFSYGEDTDLSWRLQEKGWGSWYEPTAMAYHHCGNYQQARTPQSVHYFLMRNYWLLLIKHVDAVSFLFQFPFFILTAIKQVVRVVLLEPSNIKVIAGVLGGAPNMLPKRARVRGSVRVHAICKRFFKT